MVVFAIELVILFLHINSAHCVGGVVGAVGAVASEFFIFSNSCKWENEVSAIEICLFKLNLETVLPQRWIVIATLLQIATC